jgi:SAM-dependent methyltransferase
LSPEFIRSSLARYYCEQVPDDIPIIEYDIMRCGKCLLEYASPMSPGTDAFYNWISKYADYYPKTRWEWPIVTNEIVESGSTRKSLLEIGCGSGAFLKLVGAILPEVTAIGLDPTRSAILQCEAQGLETYGETLQEYAAKSNHAQKKFDYICAFHCLEHLSEPKGLLKDLIPLTHEGSRIFFSTPYSPMSFETNWHDPLNHPPHHLTRWNATAYNELAAQLGWHVDLLGPRANNALSRTLTAVNLAVQGPRGGRCHPLVTLLLRPIATAAEMGRQLVRERLSGRVAPDVVLARFHNAVRAV